MIRFYICKHCGNIITKVEDSTVDVVCCGEEMQEIFANTVDASQEKHIPVVEIGEVTTVKIGSVEHPMTEEHHISWVVVATDKGFELTYLKASEKPEVVVTTTNKLIAVYAYCNLHGLWKTEL